MCRGLRGDGLTASPLRSALPLPCSVPMCATTCRSLVRRLSAAEPDWGGSVRRLIVSQNPKARLHEPGRRARRSGAPADQGGARALPNEVLLHLGRGPDRGHWQAGRSGDRLRRRLQPADGGRGIGRPAGTDYAQLPRERLRPERHARSPDRRGLHTLQYYQRGRPGLGRCAAVPAP